MSRPLLILFDRNFEISTAVQHCWRYQPLVQDVLGLHLNRVDVQSGDGPAPKAGPLCGCRVLHLIRQESS